MASTECDPASYCSTPIQTVETCEGAAVELGYDANVTAHVFNNAGAPAGCFVTLDRQLYLNMADRAKKRGETRYNFAKSLCELNDVPSKRLSATSMAIQACGQNRTMPTYKIVPAQLEAVLRNRSFIKACNPCALMVGGGMAALSKDLGFGGDANLDLVIMGQPWTDQQEPHTTFDLNFHSLSLTAAGCFPKCPDDNRTASLCIQDLMIQHGFAQDGLHLAYKGL